MKTRLVRIGNSRGIRIPKPLLEEAGLDDEVTLTVQSAYGTADPSPGVLHTNNAGDWITCRVTDSPIDVSPMATQYVCMGWTRTGSVPAFTGSNPTNTGAFMILATSSIDWNWQTNVYLSVTNEGNGSVDHKGWRKYGTNLTITATPEPSNAFMYWTGDTNDTTVSSNTITLTIDRARGVTNPIVAHFESTAKTLQVASEHGVPAPIVGLHTNDYSAELTCMITNPIVVNGTTQYVATGWHATGSVPDMPVTGPQSNFWWFSSQGDTWNGQNGNGWIICMFADGGNWQIDPICSNGASAGDDTIITNAYVDYNFGNQTLDLGGEFIGADEDERVFSVIFNSDTLSGATHYVIPTNDTALFLVTGENYGCGAWDSNDWQALIFPTSIVTTISTGPFNITNESSITWTWTTNYYLATSTTGSGTVDRASGWIERGSNITIQASPISGLYAFEGWSGDTNGCDISGDTLTIPAMSIPRDIVANFTGEPEQYTDRGTPYWWLELFFTNNYEYWDTNDYDLDGLLTWMEYVAGTVPTNFWSVFGILDVTPYDGSNYVRWYATTNSGVTNPVSILRSTNLMLNPAWSMIVTDAIPRSASGTNVWWDMAPPASPVHYRPSITWTNGL